MFFFNFFVFSKKKFDFAFGLNYFNKKRMEKKLYFLLSALIFGCCSMMAQEVKSMKHEYVYDGQNFTEEYIMTFDDQGRLVSTHSSANGMDGFVMDIALDDTYTYNGNTIEGESVQYFNGSAVGTSSFRYQISNGLLVSMHQEQQNGMGGLIKVDGTLEYDSNGRMKKDATTNYYEGESVTDYGYYTWTGGNLTGYELKEGGKVTLKASNTFGSQSTNSQVLGHLFGGVVSIYPMSLVGMTLGAFFWAGSHSENLMTEQTITGEDKSSVTSRFEYDMDGNGLITTIRVFVGGQQTDTFYITWGEGGSNIRDIAASRSSSQCYSLTGQAISQPKKGFYICNGRKYLVKER